MTASTVKYNRKTPKNCPRCHGTGFVRGYRHDDTILQLKLGRGNKLRFTSVCPCTAQGLTNLDPATLKRPERAALKLFSNGISLKQIAARQRCTIQQVSVRIAFAASVLGQFPPELQLVHHQWGENPAAWLDASDPDLRSHNDSSAAQE